MDCEGRLDIRDQKHPSDFFWRRENGPTSEETDLIFVGSWKNILFCRSDFEDGPKRCVPGTLPDRISVSSPIAKYVKQFA